MSNTFKLADRFNVQSPLNNTFDRVGFYKKAINFEDLVSLIKANKPNLIPNFDYQLYKSTQQKVEIEQSIKTDNIRVNKYLVNVPFTVKEEEENKERPLYLYGKLNKKNANVRTDIYIARTIINPQERQIDYNILFVYENFDGRKNSSDRSDVNRVAINIGTHTYDDYKALYKYLGYKNTQIENDVFEKFTKAFSSAETSPFDLAFAYNKAPNFVLQRRNTELLWKDLSILLKELVFESKEKAILKILKALAIDEASINEKTDEEKKNLKAKANGFLYRLMLHSGGKSIFEKLYDKLNNYGFGDDNFTALINLLYGVWKLSSFVEDDYEENVKGYKGGPETLPYENTKVLGFYNNNFEFTFVKDNSRLKIKAIQEEVTFEKPSQFSRRPRRKVTKKEVATYNLFHPIKLAEIPKSGELKVPDKIIPAFFLKAMDDLSKWSNLEDGILLTVDVVTTATGVGNLYKLRHLRHLTKLKNIKPVSTLFKVKTAVSFIEVTAGTLNIMLTLADSDSPFAQKLQQYLFWLELASLGTDVVVEKLLKKSASEALDEGELLLKKTKETRKKEQIEETLDHLDEFVERRLVNDWDGGKLLSERTLKKRIRKLLLNYKNFKLEVRFVDETTNTKKLKDWNNRKVLGSFTKGPPPILFFRREVTELTWQHEIWHLEDLKALGLNRFYKIPNWEHEESIWKKIWQTKEKWTENELIDSYLYYKKSCKEEGIIPELINELEDLLEKPYYKFVRYKK